MRVVRQYSRKWAPRFHIFLKTNPRTDMMSLTTRDIWVRRIDWWIAVVAALSDTYLNAFENPWPLRSIANSIANSNALPHALP